MRKKRLRTRIKTVQLGADQKGYVLQRHFGFFVGWKNVAPIRAHTWQVHGDSEEYHRRHNEHN